MILKQVSDKGFEIAGTVFGLLASATIATQVYAEYSTDRPSTVSVVYVAGFLVILPMIAKAVAANTPPILALEEGRDLRTPTAPNNDAAHVKFALQIDHPVSLDDFCWRTRFIRAAWAGCRIGRVVLHGHPALLIQ